MKELIILAHVPTDSINEGFIPAARRLGLSVTLLTDHAEAHRRHFSQPGLDGYPDDILACDVFNPLAVIGLLTSRTQHPAAIFSNSDHLQTSTAVVADYFGLPCKDWHVTYRAKNKAEMRAALQRRQLDTLWFATVCNSTTLSQLTDNVPFPCIVKPREGVASQEVSLAHDHTELHAQCEAVWRERPGLPLLLEEFIDGPLYTLETLGDGKQLYVLGGFQVSLSPPPYFVELEAKWGSGPSTHQQEQVLDMIRRFGIGFGACHTEYVMTAKGPRLIEINYRNIGDYREFLLQDTLGIPLFDIVLRLYLGEPMPKLELARNAALIRYFTAQSAGRLSDAPDAFINRQDGFTLAYKPLRAAGDAISVTHSNKDYLGVLRGTGPDGNRLRTEMDRISQSLNWRIAA